METEMTADLFFFAGMSIIAAIAVYAICMAAWCIAGSRDWGALLLFGTVMIAIVLVVTGLLIKSGAI